MIDPTNALTVTWFRHKKRAVRRAAPDEVGSQPLHAVMKRPSDKLHSSLVRSKKRGLTTGITALEGSWFQIASRFAQPLAKRPNDKRLSVILDSTKKRAAKEKKRAAKEEKTAP